MKILDNLYYKKKCNTLQNKIDDLKIENYDLIKEKDQLRDEIKSYKELVNKVKKMPKEIKKEYEL